MKLLRSKLPRNIFSGELNERVSSFREVLDEDVRNSNRFDKGSNVEKVATRALVDHSFDVLLIRLTTFRCVSVSDYEEIITND